MIPNIAIRAGEVSRSFRPRAWIRRSARDISGDRTPSELPHSDTCCAKLHRQDRSTRAIELRAKGSVVPGINAAADVGARAGGAVDAVSRQRLASLLPLDVHGAARGGVERHLVVGAADYVHGFHDVDLAVRGPV